MQDKKELRVTFSDHPTKVMYNAKEFLLSKDFLDISSGTQSCYVAARAAETLKRLGYITFEDIKTLTIVENGRRITKLVITVKKTKDFEKLYQAHEEERKKREEERKKEEEKKKEASKP